VYFLSLSVVATEPCGVLVKYIYDNSRFVGSQVSHALFFFVVCGFETELFVVVCVVLCCAHHSSCSVL
jgi:hypothetical protein